MRGVKAKKIRRMMAAAGWGRPFMVGAQRINPRRQAKRNALAMVERDTQKVGAEK